LDLALDLALELALDLALELAWVQSLVVGLWAALGVGGLCIVAVAVVTTAVAAVATV
jgi:hypothetical protein